MSKVDLMMFHSECLQSKAKILSPRDLSVH